MLSGAPSKRKGGEGREGRSVSRWVGGREGRSVSRWVDWREGKGKR